MKTIKDFKMKCADIQQRDEVIRILEENCKIHFFKSLDTDDDLCISYWDAGFSVLSVIDFAVPKEELTYSEFIQLYAEPKKDELVELKEWIDKNQNTIETQDGIKGGVVWVDEILSKINEMIERRKK